MSTMLVYSQEGGFDKYNHANSEIMSNYCKNNCFLIINFSTNHGKNITQWRRGPFTLRSAKRLTYRTMSEAESIRAGVFWMNKRVPMINKKYCKIQAIVTAKIKEQYLSKYALQFGKSIQVSTDKH
jgi:hypothetical protein